MHLQALFNARQSDPWLLFICLRLQPKEIWLQLKKLRLRLMCSKVAGKMTKYLAPVPSNSLVPECYQQWHGATAHPKYVLTQKTFCQKLLKFTIKHAYITTYNPSLNSTSSLVCFTHIGCYLCFSLLT